MSEAAQYFVDRWLSTPAGQACRRLRDEERHQRDNPVWPLTVEEAERRASVICKSWDDRELAQSHENDLRQAILLEIALRQDYAKELAVAALGTRACDEYPR